MEAWDTFQKKDWNQAFTKDNNSVWYRTIQGQQIKHSRRKDQWVWRHGIKAIQNETQGKKRKGLWSPLCFCLLRYPVLQTLASLISDSQVHVLQLRESVRLHFSYLSLCQGLDSLPKQGFGAIILIALFISHLSEKTIFHCLVSSVLKTTISYNSFSFLVVSGDKSSIYYHTVATVEVNSAF